MLNCTDFRPETMPVYFEIPGQFGPIFALLMVPLETPQCLAAAPRVNMVDIGGFRSIKLRPRETLPVYG